MAFKKRFLAKLSEAGITISRFTDESAGVNEYEIKALDVNVVNSSDAAISAGIGAVDDDAAANGTSDASVISLLKSFIVSGVKLLAGENHIGQVGGAIITAESNTIIRPNDTTTYAQGDLVANNTSGASVTPFTFTAARIAAGSFSIRRARMRKSSVGVTNTSFRLHLYTTTPGTITNGDNGAWSTSGVATYLGSIDITLDRAFTDGASGVGIPNVGSEISVKLASGQTIVGLLEARAAYVPTAQETIILTLELYPD